MTRRLANRLSKIERRTVWRLPIIALCRICDKRFVTLDGSQSWEREPNESAETFEHRVREEARRSAMRVVVFESDLRGL